MRLLRNLLVTLSLLFVFPMVSTAQPCGAPPLPPCDPGEPVPISGIELLIGAGALLGAKKMLNKRNHKY